MGDDDVQIVEPASKKPKPATIGAPRHWINDYFVRGDKVSSVGLLKGRLCSRQGHCLLCLCCH